MITLSGFEPDKDIEIKVIGKRPGEKVHEVLVSDREKVVGREFGKILRIGFQEEDQSILNRLDELERHMEHADDLAVLKALQQIVPEFVPVRPPD